MTILDDINATRTSVELTRARLGALQIELSELLGEEISLKQEADDLKKLAEIIAHLITSSYGDSLEATQRLLNYGVKTAYGRDLKIVISHDIKASRPTLKIGILDGSNEPVSPDKAHGGGLSQIIGFLTRTLLISSLGKRKIMILDEPFSAVSADLLPDLAILIKEIVDKLQFQVIMVTHQRELGETADRAYELTAPGIIEQV